MGLARAATHPGLRGPGRPSRAGTANSLDRVYIEAPYDGDAIVSVTDNDALVAELGRRCGLGPGCEQGN